MDLIWNHQMPTEKQQKNWIVRDGDGKIYGPFTTEQVLVQIDRGYFVGGEEVALYPGGRWIAISGAPEFYDRLLDALAMEGRSAKASSKKKAATQAAPPSPPKKTDDGDGDIGAKTVPVFVEPMEQQNSRALTTTGQSDSTVPAVIELTDLKRLESLEEEADAEDGDGGRRRYLPFVLIAVAVLAVLAVLFSDELMGSRQSGGRIRLIAPRTNQAELPLEKIKEKYKRAITSIQSDVFSGYQQAQSDLVEVVEGLPKDPERAAQTVEVFSTLCLTYRELWPYSYQDAQDTKVIREVLQQAKRLDPAGLHGAICDVVQMLLSTNYREADRLAASRLEEEGQAPVLFEMRADAYLSIGDFPSAAVYYERARLLWPAWQKLAIGEARARAKTKNFGQAMTLYRGVLQVVPHHPVAKIELGLIEAREFDHQDKGLQLLMSAVTGEERAPRDIVSEGWLGLAEIAVKRRQKNQAIEYAKKAFETNSGNARARDLLAQVAGEAGVKGTKVASRELVFMGDQHVKSGDCFQAQAEYRSAFDSDPKNGIAAMKAGKCLWQLNQSTEAIEWMKRAISAEPGLSSAYVELADYYAQRYDYQSAFRVLQRIQQLQPNNYEVFRGFALVELRRNNFQGAVQFGGRALKLYGTDLETFLLMARAYIGLRDYSSAQAFARKALEIDGANVDAHGLMGKIEAGIQGVEQGAAYLQRLLNGIVISKGQAPPPAAIAYRVALSEIYLQDEKYHQAEEVARQAVSLDPNNKKALMAVGKVLQLQGLSREALEMFLKAAVLDPSDADPIFYSGQVYTDVGKYNESVAQFQRVLKVNPRYPRSHVELGRAFLKMRKYKEALSEANAERDLNPDLADAYLLAGEAFYELKQYSNCAAEYQKAVAKQAKGASILVRMARCYRLNGSLDPAQSLLRQAQALESGNPDIYKEQGAIFHTRAMADEAISAYDTYLRLVPNAPDKAEVEARIRRVQSGDMTVEGQ